jgi:hypothetical protein
MIGQVVGYFKLESIYLCLRCVLFFQNQLCNTDLVVVVYYVMNFDGHQYLVQLEVTS